MIVVSTYNIRWYSLIIWVRVGLIITCFTVRRKMCVSIVTSDYQKVYGYIRSLAIIPRAVFDTNSAVGFVHDLPSNKTNWLDMQY